MPLFLLSALFNVRRWASAGLSWLTASATHILAVALACAVVWGALEHRGKVKWQGQARGAIAGREADRAGYVAAQAEAGRLALAAKQATGARYSALAGKVDHDAQIALIDADRRTVDYIAHNRLRPANGSAGGASGNSVSAAPDHSTQGGNRPGAEALVAVSADDVRICSVNTTRLEAVRTWAIGLGE